MTDAATQPTAQQTQGATDARGDTRREEAEARISVENVYKIFGPNPDRAYQMLQEGRTKDEIFDEIGATVGVQDANFTVYSGEVFVIMGLSGSGKSTMVRMLNRLIDPTYGAVKVRGQDITQLDRNALIEMRRRDMSMVFQSFALMPHQTVIENAAFGLEISGKSKADRYARAQKALDAVGLGANANSYPSELSGGMKQRVGLARALANDPPILLMDEAFSALDPLIRTEMQDELLRLQKESQRTVVFISHDLDEAMRIGDRIAIMEDGRFVQIDTPDEIVMNPADEYVSSFFKNVDVSQVFRSGDIARTGVVTELDVSEAVSEAALERLAGDRYRCGVVRDGSGIYKGLLSHDGLKTALAEGKDADSAYVAEVEPIRGDMALSGVLKNVAESAWPVPVIDEAGKYLGTITQGTLLQTLNRHG